MIVARRVPRRNKLRFFVMGAFAEGLEAPANSSVAVCRRVKAKCSRAISDRAAPVDKRNSGVASAPTSPRGGTKIAQVIELLQRGKLWRK